jgi:hypothetical protein
MTTTSPALKVGTRNCSTPLFAAPGDDHPSTSVSISNAHHLADGSQEFGQDCSFSGHRSSRASG